MAAWDAAGEVCTYDGSKRQFRGPRRALDSPYIACIGSEETFGRFVDTPFPAALEHRLDRRCVNFGSLFCGAEALQRDQGLRQHANSAEYCVLQLPNLFGQSNLFYRVHSRRNDRFVAPTQDLRALYPEQDFTDIHFVGHLISHLQRYDDARFEVVAVELRRSWLACIADFLDHVETPVALLLLDMAPDGGGLDGPDPVPMTAETVAALRSRCAALVEIQVQMSGASDELEDMLFGTLQQPIAEFMIGPATHRRIADVLSRAILEKE